MIDEARRLGVAGWVRNRRDGTVEAVVDGEPTPSRRSSAGRAGAHPAPGYHVAVDETDGTFAEFDWLPTA